MGKEYRREIDVISNAEMPMLPLYANDFEHMFEEDAAGMGTDWILRHDTEIYVSGGASLYFHTRTVGAADNDLLYNRFYYPAPNWLKFQMVAVVQIGDNVSNEIEVEFRPSFADPDGVNWHIYGVRLDFNLQRIFVYTGAGWTNLIALPDILPQNWITIILEVDNQNHVYTRLQIKKTEYDVAGLPYGATGAGNLVDRVEVSCITTDTTPVDMYLDKLIMRGLQV